MFWGLLTPSVDYITAVMAPCRGRVLQHIAFTIHKRRGTRMGCIFKKKHCYLQSRPEIVSPEDAYRRSAMQKGAVRWALLGDAQAAARQFKYEGPRMRHWSIFEHQATNHLLATSPPLINDTVTIESWRPFCKALPCPVFSYWTAFITLHIRGGDAKKGYNLHFWLQFVYTVNNSKIRKAYVKLAFRITRHKLTE